MQLDHQQQLLKCRQNQEKRKIDQLWEIEKASPFPTFQQSLYFLKFPSLLLFYLKILLSHIHVSYTHRQQVSYHKKIVHF
jgi:hypothetical protein